MLTKNINLSNRKSLSIFLLQVSFLSLSLFFFTSHISAQVYTTQSDGDWSNSSTWIGGSAPGNNISDKTVIINHNVDHNSTIKLQKNANLVINNVLNLTSGSIELEKLSSTIDLNLALLIIANGNVSNKKGLITLNAGAIQIGNGNYTDESNSNNAGTLGDGYIYVNNGNIENNGNSPFSSGINWCTTSGNGSGLPTTENCSVAEPPSQNYNNQTFYMSVLPVELSYFTGEANDCNVELFWASKSEEAFAFYEVQRSTDETHYEVLTSINGIGGDFEQAYEFTDYNAGLKNYYRLKMVDWDGSFEYSDLIIVETDCRIDNKIIIYPNPVKKSTSVVNIKFLAPNNQIRLSVSNQQGIEISRFELNTISGSWNAVKLPISELPSGIYFIKDLDSRAVNTFIIQE